MERRQRESGGWNRGRRRNEDNVKVCKNVTENGTSDFPPRERGEEQVNKMKEEKYIEERMNEPIKGKGCKEKET